MPIRTNRGRAAVYRKLWGWPLRSPRHLAATAFVLVLLIGAIGFAAPKLLGRKGVQQAQDPVAAAASAVPSSGPRATTAPPASSALPTLTRITEAPTPSSAPPSSAGVDVAVQWAKEYVNHPSGTTLEEWTKRLEPYTTPEYLGQLRSSVDLANVFPTQVLGQPEVRESHPKSVVVDVTTDDGKLRITAVETPVAKGPQTQAPTGTPQWRVDEHEPVE
ncbi:hypothetical protein [Actinokineospora bangkokensis]|uniref:Uncharacterized protein n=1 Tax=Actinokineospora bangkokensis TaxID=1193682 RepID=A0A1Q9LDV7_9PSEU|nr:hypothetical protein [Actinokineospora bangkokensis]OLR90192.1 hypothetical protein BJP25_04330 [Actinokineospora bangkokensis]